MYTYNPYTYIYIYTYIYCLLTSEAATMQVHIGGPELEDMISVEQACGYAQSHFQKQQQEKFIK